MITCVIIIISVKFAYFIKACFFIIWNELYFDNITLWL